MAVVPREEDVVIIGAGIAGLATSLALHRLGIKSLVLESATSLRVTGFALGTWTNAWRALDALGIGNHLRQQHRLLDGVVFASTITGGISVDMSLTGTGHELRRVHRKLLIGAMEKELPNGTIRYSSKVVSMEGSESDCYKLLHLGDGTIIKAKVLIGCDGVNSLVAKWIGLNEAVTSGRSGVRGSATFPEGHGFTSKLFMFVGKGFRAGCLPCDDNTIYWYFSWTPSIQEHDLLYNPSKLKEYVLSKLQNAPDLKKVVEKTELDSVMSSPLRYRNPWEFLWKKLTRGNVCVAGDALHPMTPDLSQGGCAALEDSVTLGRCLAEALKKNPGPGGEDTETCEQEYRRIELGLREYAKERRWRSFKLIATGCLAGRVQQSQGNITTFLRDRVLAKFLAGLLLQIAEFDCGTLTSR
ncbi:unnamed protein product [Linum tenue]|uniref:FAD-binding domain-containing protein n=1 Tax=Linum tenue TaxID=586396 RepID=A0AAV0PCA0_9ROSI|nr:unnamed protein product [Linum tenue]